jgi:hypothetical protein
MNAALQQMQALSSERSKFQFAVIDEDPDKYDVYGDDKEQAQAELRERVSEFAKELDAKLKKYADDNGFVYVESSLLTPSDLQDDEEYPIGQAAEPQDNPFSPQATSTVLQTVFTPFFSGNAQPDPQSIDTQLYMPHRAVSTSFGLDGSESHYAYWTIDYSLSHVPSLDEPGIREDVVLTWKRIKARELAQKRAEELADRVRSGLQKEGEERQSMAAALEDVTVDGEADSATLAVRQTLPFSWLRASSASPNSFQQAPPTMSTIMFSDETGGVLQMVGNDFMKSIFEDLSDEEVGVVPNGDLSTLYVVHVTNRFPTPEIGEDDLRQRFAQEGKMFGFRIPQLSPFVNVMQQEVASPTVRNWQSTVLKKYDIDPDAQAETEN